MSLNFASGFRSHRRKTFCFSGEQGLTMRDKEEYQTYKFVIQCKRLECLC